jgi:hypothetical protein
MPSRREALKRAGAIIVGARVLRLESPALTIAGEPVEITVASLSSATARITIRHGARRGRTARGDRRRRRHACGSGTHPVPFWFVYGVTSHDLATSGSRHSCRS